MSKDDTRFWSKVRKTSSCWLWTGSAQPAGYGLFWLGGKYVTAHRHSYTMARRNPGSHHVRHTCDNPACVNPKHLVAGTHKQNMQDCVARGRRPRGSKHYLAKLTEADVRAILRDSRKQVDVAKDYNVSKYLISNIKAGRAWSWLQPEVR